MSKRKNKAGAADGHEPTTSRPTCCNRPMPDPYRWKHTTTHKEGKEPERLTILFFRCPKCRRLKCVTITPAHGDL